MRSQVWLGVGSALLMGLMGCGESSPESQLNLVVNGEAFAEAGLLSKDQWQLTFDQVGVTVGPVEAVGVPLETTDDDRTLQVSWQSPAEAATMVALQDGPVSLGSQPATVGNYNQLNWQFGSESEGAIALKGTAVQGDRTIQFDVRLLGAFQVACGDYVGDERKGIVTAESPGEVELTLHLDHLFGDGESPPSAEVNTTSLGFDPLAEAAEGDVVTLQSPADWEQWGTPELREALRKQVMSMPHVGEGHCDVEPAEAG